MGHCAMGGLHPGQVHDRNTWRLCNVDIDCRSYLSNRNLTSKRTKA